ncbi:Mdm33 family-domain-containing protein [Naematelia encephala]|uniref:Sensitive to high expression protein 9, mitochondrial n=1 Tax=Naematelia encephala TaxID=71784 RepID=A0A1Y2AGR2_9TREE|nr:Mdm33 family-domain-containing protein [Naematelia encephala]
MRPLFKTQCPESFSVWSRSACSASPRPIPLCVSRRSLSQIRALSSNSSSSDTASTARPRPEQFSDDRTADSHSDVKNKQYTSRGAEWSNRAAVALLQKHTAGIIAFLANRRQHIAKETGRHLSRLNAKINEATGYEEVERLKRVVHEQELALTAMRSAARKAKLSYEEAILARSTAQRDVNSLLERKHSWTDMDLSRFTELVRSDHASTQAVAQSAVQLEETERGVDKAFTDLTRAILERYHEEQVWSDKIRSVSTWINIVGLAVNLIVFLGAVAIVEPWKRKRLVERLEEKIAGMMDRVETGIAGLADKVDSSREHGSSLSDAAQFALPPPTASMGNTEEQSDIGPSWLRGPLSSVLVALDEWGSRDVLAAGALGLVSGIALTASFVALWSKG